MTSDDMGLKSIQKAITQARFKFILGKLHLNDNNKIDKANPDKLWKIKSLINHLNTVKLRYYATLWDREKVA